MDIAYKLFLALHLFGVALGGAPAFGHLVTGGLAARDASARPFAMKAGKGLAMVGKFGFLALIVSGPAMIWMAWALDTLSAAFWVKMALVLALVANIGMATVQGARAERGDAAAGARLGLHARIGAGLMVALIVTAVLAFR